MNCKVGSFHHLCKQFSWLTLEIKTPFKNSFFFSLIVFPQNLFSNVLKIEILISSTQKVLSFLIVSFLSLKCHSTMDDNFYFQNKNKVDLC